MKILEPIGLLVLVLPAAVWRACVAIVLWGWFVTPSFGVSAPPLWHMAGLFLLVGLALAGIKTDYDPEQAVEERVFTAVFKAIFIPLIFLAFGWLFHVLGGVA